MVLPYWLLITKGYGLTPYDIGQSCPADLQPYEDAYMLQMKQRDAEIWSWCGNYGYSAIATAISNNFSKNYNAKYIKHPMLEGMRTKPLTEEEKMLEVDKFFAQEDARRANWKQSHRKKE